jgi:hypothetical protein
VLIDEALGRELQKLWHRFDVPIAVADVRMAKVRGELGKLALDVETCAIPSHETGGCESMAHVVKPRAAPTAVRRRGRA